MRRGLPCAVPAFVLAVLLQFLGPVLTAQALMGPLQDPIDAVAICSADGGHTAPAPTHRHEPSCTACPANCVGLQQPGLASSAAVVPLPQARPADDRTRAAANGPRAPPGLVPKARSPPTLA